MGCRLVFYHCRPSTFLGSWYLFLARQHIGGYQSPQRLIWAGHLARTNENRCCKKIFLAKPLGNGLRGSPPLRWIDCFEKDWKTVAKSIDVRRKLLEKAGAHPRLSSH
ncbi:hypothetical protein TNCV_1286001 [Trichonephila clavipes]|uniref:Uncharacterized protein n=1 Tax=Trichonephila clavipes TaxID=2585209 RepID=A0A8X6SQQ1_TRICX|nr:hypothetical protein TNCV_1286001 [Trichonephila clavipes]